MKDNRLSRSNSEKNVGNYLVPSVILNMEPWCPREEGDLLKVTCLLRGAVRLELISPESDGEPPLTPHVDRIFILQASCLFFWLYRLLKAGRPLIYRLRFLPAASGCTELASVFWALRQKARRALRAVALHRMYRRDVFLNVMLMLLSLRWQRRLALRFRTLHQNQDTIPVSSKSILKWKMFDCSSPWRYLHVLCVMIQRESIGHCILKIRIGILLLGNLVTPINLCLTNPLKIWCSSLQLSPCFQEWQQMLQSKHLY